jgi:hypothetical protein
MNNIIVITNSMDIPAAQSLSMTLDNYAVYTFDPALPDRLASANLENIKFIDCPHYVATSEYSKWAQSAAFDIENKLNNEVKELLPGISINSWQYLSFYHFFILTKWYSNLWGRVSHHFSDCKVHVLVCDRPAYHLTASFIPSILLMQSILNHGIALGAYTYAGNTIETDVMPDIFRDDMVDDFDILVHLPTCFYDISYFNSELAASEKNVLNISSQIWPVHVQSKKTIDIRPYDQIKNKFTDSISSQLSVFTEKITEKLDTLLVPYISSPLYRSRQAFHFATIYKCQLATQLLLEDYFKQKKPSKILLSNHDAGFHGPILSFSQKNSIPVVMVPHSKIGYDLAFNGNNIIHLTHPIQGEYTLDKTGKRVLNFTLAYPENFKGTTTFPQRIKKIGLLLNSIGSYGVMNTEYESYMNGIKKIHQWCIQNGIELAIRCRPGETIINTLNTVFEIDIKSMLDSLTIPISEYALSVDLCLMYDIPTTAQIDFLKLSIPLLNPVPDDLVWSIAKFSNKNLIPRGSVDTILDTLDTFVSDETNFFLFKNSQFSDYVNLFKNGLPLRSFL